MCGGDNEVEREKSLDGEITNTYPLADWQSVAYLLAESFTHSPTPVRGCDTHLYIIHSIQ